MNTATKPITYLPTTRRQVLLAGDTARARVRACGLGGCSAIRPAGVARSSRWRGACQRVPVHSAARERQPVTPGKP